MILRVHQGDRDQVTQGLLDHHSQVLIAEVLLQEVVAACRLLHQAGVQAQVAALLEVAAAAHQAAQDQVAEVVDCNQPR